MYKSTRLIGRSSGVSVYAEYNYREFTYLLCRGSCRGVGAWCPRLHLRCPYTSLAGVLDSTLSKK